MYIEAPELASYPNIKHAFFTRVGGVSQGIYASLNGGLGSVGRPGACGGKPAADGGRPRPGLKRAPVSVHQVHSFLRRHRGGTLERGAPESRRHGDRGDRAGAGDHDGRLWPVLFADPHVNVIGAAHAGWRGALTGC